MLSTCVATVTVALSSSVLAQSTSKTSDADQLQTVVITALHRSTEIQQTPVAISAISGKTLDQSFTTSVAGLNAVVPSLEITKASGFENLVTIRGVGSETPENGLTTSPGVSEFIDGVYIANTISLDQTLFDIHDIEVLRGPQGALYGQSAIGGAIIISTNQPQIGVFSGGGDASIGTYQLFRGRAEFNIPLGDDFALRISGQKYQHDGFTKDLALPGFRLDDAYDSSGKASLLWKPNDHFSATLTAQLYQSSQNGDAQKNVNDPASDPRELYQDYPGHFALKTQLYHLNLQWDEPDFSIRSVTAYQGLDHVQQEDSSRSSFALLVPPAYDDVAAWNTHVHNYTQEIDVLSPPGSQFEWIGGAFVMYQGSKQFIEEFKGSTAPTPADLQLVPANSGPFPANLGYGNVSHILRRSYAVFAQGTYHFTPSLRITAGVRDNIDNFKDDSYNFSAFSLGNPANSQQDHVPTWRVEADYDLTPDNMIYASYARGYKPGGVNGDSNPVIIRPTFHPETNDAFELGSKNAFFDKTLKLNAALFYYEHRDFQYIETDPVPFEQGIATIPGVRDYGAEFEATYASPDSRFHANGSLALERGEVQGTYKTLDSTVANAIEQTPACGFGFNPGCYPQVIAAEANIAGKTPPGMPTVSGAFSMSYRFDVPTGTLTPWVEYVYRGAEWSRIFNVAGLDYVDPYGVTNLNIEYVPTNSRLKVDLSATNLFNVAGINSRYTDPYGTGQTSQEYIPPLQVIGTIAYAF